MSSSLHHQQQHAIGIAGMLSAAMLAFGMLCVALFVLWGVLHFVFGIRVL